MTPEERLALVASLPSLKRSRGGGPQSSPDSEASSRKRKREESGATSTTSGMTSPVPSLRADTPTALGRVKYEAAEALIQAIPADLLEEHRRKLKTGFKLYHLANRDEASAGLKAEEKTDRHVEKQLSKR